MVVEHVPVPAGLAHVRGDRCYTVPATLVEHVGVDMFFAKDKGLTGAIHKVLHTGFVFKIPELLPEPMRLLRERAGIARIKQLLG